MTYSFDQLADLAIDSYYNFVLCLYSLVAILFLVFVTTPAVIQYLNYDEMQAIQKREISTNIYISMAEHHKTWSPENIQTLANVLYIGQKEFDIPHQTILAIMSIESQFTLKAINYNKGSKSTDFGVAQVNSKTWPLVAPRAMEILSTHSVPFQDNKYDLALNVMNSFVYLNGTEEELGRRNSFNKYHWIKSYNVGVSGSLKTSGFYKVRGDLYYSKYLKYEKLYTFSGVEVSSNITFYIQGAKS